MINYIEIARLYEAGTSRNQIAKTVHSGKDTVGSVMKKLTELNLTSEDLKKKGQEELDEIFGFQSSRAGKTDPMYVQPNYEYYAEELKKPGVTMKQLWKEYRADCKAAALIPYQETQFKKHFHEYLDQKNFADIIHHKPGETGEVDWNGTRVWYIDPDTGEHISAYMFVGVLSYSSYGYAEVRPAMKSEDVIESHVHMFEYFGGVPKILIPDNMRTAVTRHPRNEEPELNRIYNEMAEYYGAVVIPARVREPDDKPAAEGSVRYLTTAIIAALRNIPFFSIDEYNAQLRIKLDEYNRQPFTNKPYSRQELMDADERDSLIPLPKYPFEYAEWRTAKVAENSHISVERKYYSVPYRYIGKRVDVKITCKELSIYYDSTLLCTHPHLSGYPGQYSTDPSHMPKYSNAACPWNKDRYMKWANRIGQSTVQVVTGLFAHYKVEQQAYLGVKSILMLEKKFSSERLENACALALLQANMPRYRHIKYILENNQDLQEKAPVLRETVTAALDPEESYLRGADYYGENEE